MENDPELILEYVAESREHLSQIDSIFREIEKMKGKVEHDHLHSLFRSIHTIKGSAGFLGFTNVGKLTHAMESLLAKLRDNCRQLPETITQTLVESADYLQRMFEDVHRSHDMPIGHLESRLREHLEKPLPAEEPVDSSDSEPNQEDRGTNDVLHQPSAEGQEHLRIRIGMLDRLMMLAGELVLVRNQQLMHTEQAEPAMRQITQRLNAVTSEIQETIMRTRMQPIGNVFSRFQRLVRELARKLDKKIEVESLGNDVELDKTILDALVDPLTHIVRNSCDHGIETPAVRIANGKPALGRITLNAFHESGQIHLCITDDGKGISRDVIRRKVLEKGLKKEEEIARMSDPDLLSLVFLPGFSTATEVTDISGRGVGMDVVKTSIERFGGTLEITSTEGEGTTLKMRLPLTLAIIPSLIVEAVGERFAIPQVNLEELVCLYDNDVLTRIECAGPREVFRLRDTLLPMIRLSEILAKPTVFDEDSLSEVTERMHAERMTMLKSRPAENGTSLALNFAVLRSGNQRFGLIIDKIHGTEEIVVKPMHRAVKHLSIYSGATVLGDGKVAMILDILGLARHGAVQAIGKDEIPASLKNGPNRQSENQRSLLIFHNGGPEQFALPMLAIKRIERVETTAIEQMGSHEYLSLDGTSTRIMRIADCLPITRTPPKDIMYLLLPHNARKPYGLLVEGIVDSGLYTLEINSTSFQAAGIEGSTLIKNKMTLVLEPTALVDNYDNGWYAK